MERVHRRRQIKARASRQLIFTPTFDHVRASPAYSYLDDRVVAIASITADNSPLKDLRVWGNVFCQKQKRKAGSVSSCLF